MGARTSGKLAGSRAPESSDALTRATLLRAVACGSAVVGGGVAVGTATDGTSSAADSAEAEAKVLNLFLTLEYVQESFYRQAVRTGLLDGALLAFARTVAEQEAQHVAFLQRRLGRRAEERPRTDAGALLGSPEGFRTAAVDLEEAAISAYVGQGANLSGTTRARIGTLVSVEARQAAWIRDLARTSPAPRAADPGRDGETVLAELRDKGLLG
jgi:hypothetical protein